MTRGHRPTSTATSSSSATAASSSSSSSNSFQQQQTPRRGNKTLGWYLGDKLNGSTGNEGDGGGGGDISSICSGQMAPQKKAGLSQQQQRRRGSLAETTTTNCSKSSAKLTDEQLCNVKTGKRHLQQQQQKQSIINSLNHRPRANSSSTNAGAKKNGATAQTNDQMVASSISANDSTKQSSTAVTPQQRNGKGPSSGKEDYWYYDEVSDGFYYEHNGTRGWRKRRPEWGTVEQMKGMTGTEHSPKKAEDQQQLMLLQQHLLLQKQKALEAKASVAPSAAVPSLLAPQQLSKISAQHLAHEHFLPPAPANFKYYDPTTDGFYYEMASFDGWKRRQPQSSASAAGGTSPSQGILSHPSSYCSPLLGPNGEQQTKTTTTAAQPTLQCTSPGPNQQKQQTPHRKVQPPHYQAYQQPAPHLNSTELQEIILLAQQNQQHSRAAAAPSMPSCCCAQLSCCPSSAGNGASACCCTNIAAMAAQMVLKQQQKFAEKMQNHQQNNSIDNNNGLPGDFNKLSSTDNIRPLMDMDAKRSLLDSVVMDGLSKPKMVRPLKPTQYQQLMYNYNNNNIASSLKLPRNKWDHHQLGGIVPSPPPLLPSLQARNNERRPSNNLITVVATNNENTATKANTALSIGSFEEPYEFYWSGDEAGSEVVSLSTVTPKTNEQTMMDAKNEEHSMSVPPFTLSTTTTTAASVSSIEEDDVDGCGMLDEYMAEMAVTTPNSEKQRKIAPIGSEANHLGNGTKKRPNTLKLSCAKPMPLASDGKSANGLSAAYEPISPGEILRDDHLEYNNNDSVDSRKESVVDSPDVLYQFNVDKFIADLLPPSDQQQLLYNQDSSPNNSLFTPLAQPSLAADSSLCTPIVPSVVGRYGTKDPWYYGKANDFPSAHPLQQPLTDSTNPWAYP